MVGVGVGDIVHSSNPVSPDHTEFCLQKPPRHFSMLKQERGNVKAMIQRFYDPASGSVLIGSAAQQTGPSKRKTEENLARKFPR